MTTMPILPRSEIAPEYTWNAPSVFASVQDWENEYQAIIETLPEIQAFQGHLADSAEKLADAMDAIERLMRRVGKISVYTTMESSVDAMNQSAVAMESKGNGLFGRAIAVTSFVDPELLAIGQTTLNKWLAETPRLAIYKQYVNNLFRLQSHVRSAEVEEVLGSLLDPFYSVSNTASQLTNADLVFRPATNSRGEPVQVTQGNFDHELMFHTDRELRRTAYESYSDSYLSVKHALASNLSVAIKQDVFNAQVRHYPSALEAALFNNNIPPTVFTNLIETFKSHLPTWHRYWRVKRKALGYSGLQPYDIWAPLAKKSPVVSYRQAVDWICEGLKPLGTDYVESMRQGCLHDRWVDMYPNQGKRSGAFSSGWTGTFPFIMMSYTDNVASMSTLAHELGHSMHSFLTWKNQPYVYSNYSLFVAEVASNFNQAIVRAHLLAQNPDPDFQIALIDEAMDNFHRYFFIMPTLARFELEMHQRIERGEGLNADTMNGVLADLFAEGYGGEVEGSRDHMGIRWAEFGHLYANFYVYQYATGIAGAHALADRVLTGGSAAAMDYLSFLKAGSSIYPIDALKMAGVDLTTPEPVEKAFAVLASMIDRLEQLTG